MHRALLVIVCVAPSMGLAQSPILERASCASATCHGGVVDRGPTWNFSLTKWLAQDPHAGAGLLLHNEQSQAIVNGLINGSGVGQDYDTVLRRRCISCHTSATADDCSSNEPLDKKFLAAGVSCESCHGTSERWVTSHIDKSWSQLDWQGKPHEGMLDTKSIVGRARICVRCHVGMRGRDGLIRDVNHDLIAAGHPALRFDLLLYNENLPAHWNQSDNWEARFLKSAVRVRTVSRATTLSAAATLTGQRASDHLIDPSVPWPELSDYDCFACHQDLSMNKYRLPASEQIRSPLQISSGLPIWNAWHTTGQRQFSDDALKALAPNQINPRTVKAPAMALSKLYTAEAEKAANTPANASAELNRIRTTMRNAPPRNWHEAAVLYLDTDAVLRDLGKPLSPLRERIEPLLQFGRDRAGTELNSPADFDAKKFQQSILELIPNEGLKDKPARRSIQESRL